jgi:Na+-translocating ferredoxin:NAD+ oxidoreductase RnfC subunit
MPAKKKSGAADKELKATVKKLRSKLAKADARTKRLKKKNNRLEKSLAESTSQVHRREPDRHADGASRGDENALAAAVDAAAVEPATTDEASVTTPDASWTVAQLRAEARSRGLAGMSGKSKAQLLDALT